MKIFHWLENNAFFMVGTTANTLDWFKDLIVLYKS